MTVIAGNTRAIPDSGCMAGCSAHACADPGRAALREPEVSVDLYALAKMCFIRMTGVTAYLTRRGEAVMGCAVMGAVDMLYVIAGVRRISVTGITFITTLPAFPGVIVAERTILLLRMRICRAIDLMA
jgi:hypothetical protein